MLSKKDQALIFLALVIVISIIVPIMLAVANLEN